MSRLLHFWRCLLVAGSCQLLFASASWAQPTLISERKNISGIAVSFGATATFTKSFELPGHRFVHCGDAWVAIQSRTKKELALVVSKASGDTVRYRRLNLNVAGGGDYFVDAVLGPDYSLTYLSDHLEPNAVPTLPSDRTYALTQVDTLGNVRWQRRYPKTNVSAVTSLLRVPDGYLVLVNGISPASTPTTTYAQAGVAKVDLSGNPLWQRAWSSRGYGGAGLVSGLVARPDGSYLATGNTDNGTPYLGGAALPRFDTWLVQFTPQGDTIRTSRFGANGQFESGYALCTTSDGGAALSGVRRLAVPNAENEAQVVKVDSLLRPQWTYTQPATTTYPEFFGFVQATRRGDVVVGGYRFDAAQEQYYGLLTSFTRAGNARWALRHQFGGLPTHSTGFATLLSQPDSSAFIMGSTKPSGSSTYEDYFAHFANVGAPFVADLCRVRPVALFGFAPTAGGDSLRFVSLSTAGPRYAALALWHWDFGDGTSYDGPVPPPHRYVGTPGSGTRVSLTVTNNLGCTSTQAVFPFALATAQARALAAQARLWPNPTAGGATLEVAGLGAQGPVRLEVVNALGQVVQARAVAVRQGTVREVLEVRELPVGVYAVRLLAQEGIVVKRLVRE